jgi:hypothetical protein
MPTLISFEEAGRMLSPSHPWSVRQVERLAKAGHLPFYGLGKNRMTLAESVQAFFDKVASGEVSWPPRAVQPARASIVQTQKRSAPPLKSTVGQGLDVPPLRSRPPKRD